MMMMMIIQHTRRQVTVDPSGLSHPEFCSRSSSVPRSLWFVTHQQFGDTVSLHSVDMLNSIISIIRNFVQYGLWFQFFGHVLISFLIQLIEFHRSSYESHFSGCNFGFVFVIIVHFSLPYKIVGKAKVLSKSGVFLDVRQFEDCTNEICDVSRFTDSNFYIFFTFMIVNI